MPVLAPVEDQHLDRAGDRDRPERAEDPRELRADQDRDQHGERRELHRPAVDERLEDVVLDLLVDDEEDDDDDPGRDRVQECDDAEMIAAIVAPASGIRSRIATSSPSATA